jgi:tRNA modification GTPase
MPVLLECEFADVDFKGLPIISQFTVDDTICAIASPLMPARRGIVRMSGGDVLSILRRVELLPQEPGSLRSRRFHAKLDLATPLNIIAVDVLLWPTARSYTGQPSAELHVIGSLPILEAVVERLVQCGARAARPGEFTMRSFLAGRMDLPQAEAVLGVIDADDADSLNHALQQLAGNLSKPLQAARSDLLDLLADVEAGLDFVDEDIEFITDENLIHRLRALADLLAWTTHQLHERSSASSALEVVLRGLPNAGKSCLLNALASAEAAIVSEQAGTTRDNISIDVEIHGYAIRVTDTAGIETRGANEIDAEVSAKAQQQAQDAASHADLWLWCIDASNLLPNEAIEQFRIARSSETTSTRAAEHFLLLTKSDLITDRSAWETAIESIELTSLLISTRTGDGMDSLRGKISAVAERLDPTETGGVIGTAARCRGSLSDAIKAVNNAIELTGLQVGHELVAAEIRAATVAIGEVTGEVYTDDLLDRVFSRFCIGK